MVAYFPSLDAAETVEVGFIKLRLLVDSGFTGRSSFVLPESAAHLAHARAAASQVAGALEGTQTRMVVSCRVGALSFQTMAIAILADVSDLAIPPGVHGLVGLRFVRYFRRWGSERADDGTWRFFLETGAI
jgi:hypothetical protein